MSSSRLVRGAKTRMFVCICLICVLGALVYVFHGTQTKLADVQKLANACNQQQESLSAQLQVIFEYKLRLEKSLKKEKADHTATKETCKAKEKEEREARQKEKIEAANKYEALVQQCKLQKNQYEDEREKYEKSLATLKEEKKKMQDSYERSKLDIQALKKEKESATELETEFLKLQEELKKLKKMPDEMNDKAILSRLNALEKENKFLTSKLVTLEKDCKKSTVSDFKKEEDNANKVEVNSDTNALEAPKFGGSQNMSSLATPGVNPDAVALEMSSSMKPPAQEVEYQKKNDEPVIHPPKSSTQESGAAAPLPGPMDPGMLVGQIPGPPDPPADTIHRPNTNIDPQQQLQRDSDALREDHAAEVHDNNVIGPMNPVDSRIFAPEPGWGNQRRDHNNAIEDDDAEPQNFIRQRDNPEIPRPGKSHGEQYHGGDYDREHEPDEEEDDEGEQMDYVQGIDQGKREDQLKQVGQQHVRHIDNQNGGGVMVNPK